MPKKTTEYRIFIASPGGLSNERELFRSTIQEYNVRDAVPRGVLFTPVGWENTSPGIGRPEELILKDLRECDYLVLVLFDRWGSPSDKEGKFSSGTYEEFVEGKKCLADSTKSMREIVVLFKALDHSRLTDPGKQLKQVLAFRQHLEASKELLYDTFDDERAFREKLERLLAKWVRDHERKTAGKKPVEITWPVIAAAAVPKPGEAPRSADILQQTPTNKLLQKAEQHARKGRLTEAERLFATAVARGSDPEAINGYGRFLAHLGRLSQAQEMFERLLGTSGPRKDEWRAHAYGNLGVIADTRGDLNRAAQMYHDALELNKRLKMQRQIAISLHNLAMIHRRRRRLTLAECEIRQSLDLGRELKDSWIIAMALAGLGLICRDQYEASKRSRLLSEAEQTSSEALRLYQKVTLLSG